jgi:hypothetical protein
MSVLLLSLWASSGIADSQKPDETSCRGKWLLSAQGMRSPLGHLLDQQSFIATMANRTASLKAHGQ